MLFSQAPDTRLVAPRLAGRLGAGVVMNGVDVTVGDGGALEATASAYGGDTRMIYALSGASAYVVALNTTALLPEPIEGGSTTPESRSVAVDLSGTQERIRVIEPPRTEGPRLEEADIIVSGGRGLGSPENYKLVEQLAEALGGLAGASRPIVDEGWVDSSRQVGLTGKITRPALYLAAGISGASQHMAGCSAAKTIVAINRDPDASIFRYCRYGLGGRLPGDPPGADPGGKAVRRKEEGLAMTEPIPVAEGLFAQTAEGPRLLGSRCRSCEAPYFPRSPCVPQSRLRRQPDGRHRASARAARSGAAPSRTIPRRRRPDTKSPTSPYAVGVVDLDEGLRVVGRMSVRRSHGAAGGQRCGADHRAHLPRR